MSKNKEWSIMNREVEKLLADLGIFHHCPECKRPALKYRVIDRKTAAATFEFQCGSNHKWTDSKDREW
jgi:hypothetical protein